MNFGAFLNIRIVGERIAEKAAPKVT